MKYLKRLIEIFLLAFAFLLPFQTKLILLAGTNNFTEISLYLSHLALILALVCFLIYQFLNRQNNKVPIYWYFMLAFVSFYSFSLFFAADRILALYKISLLLLAVGLFYMLRFSLAEDSLLGSVVSRLKLIYAFLLSVFLHAILAIYQFLSQSTFANKYLGLALHNPELVGTSVIEASSGRWLRAYGGLDHPNILAGVLVVALLLSAYLLLKRKIINSRLQIYGILSIFVGYFVYLTALFFTFSRSAWLALIVGALTLLVFFIKKEDKWTTGRYIFLLFFSLILFTFLSFSFKDIITTRLQASSRLEQVSLTERSDELQTVTRFIKKQAWFGLGAGNYTIALSLQEINNKYPQPVHNSFLLLFAESGVFSVLALLFFIFFFFKDSRRGALSIAVILALLVLMFFEHWFFSLPFGVLFFMFILGLI